MDGWNTILSFSQKRPIFRGELLLLVFGSVTPLSFPDQYVTHIVAFRCLERLQQINGWLLEERASAKRILFEHRGWGRLQRFHKMENSRFRTWGKSINFYVGGFIFLFIAIPGEMIQFDDRIFFRWVGEKTTNWILTG